MSAGKSLLLAMPFVIIFTHFKRENIFKYLLITVDIYLAAF